MKEFVTSGGVRLSFGDTGQGKPLLFLHGWLMSHSVWTYQSPLADRFRVLAPDLRGHGASEGSGFSYDACVADLVELLDHLELEDTIIVGWSMGAQIALRLRTVLRERVVALVLVGGTPRFCAHDGYEHGLPSAEVRAMALRLRRNYTRAAGEFYRDMFSPDDEREIDTSVLAKTIVSRLPQLPVALAALDELVSTDLRTLLQEVTLPVLLVHGETDRICLPGASRFIHSILPHSRMKLLPGVGHAPFIVRPAEFNADLSAFARGVYDAD